MGYTRDDLPTRSKDILPYVSILSRAAGEELGTYVSNLLTFFGMEITDANTKELRYQIDDEKLKYSDEKSERLLQQIFNGRASEPLNLTLLLFLTHVNFLLYVLNNFAREEHYTVFKLKYLVLYHLRSSLEKLYNQGRTKGTLTRRSMQYLATILLDEKFAELAALRGLRNILMHYGIGRKLEGQLSLDTELFGLAEFFFDGNSYQVAVDRIEAQLVRVSEILEQWLNWHVRDEKLRSW